MEEKEQEKAVEPTDKIKEANEAAERMEEATEKMKEENDRKESLAIESKLSGTTEAGKEPEKKKEETDKEYVDKIRENGFKVDG